LRFEFFISNYISIARGVTAVTVGSGDLFGHLLGRSRRGIQHPRDPNLVSGFTLEDSTGDILGLILFCFTRGARMPKFPASGLANWCPIYLRKQRRPVHGQRSGENRPAATLIVGRMHEKHFHIETFISPNVRDEPRSQQARLVLLEIGDSSDSFQSTYR
jgi:hypothetical protein